MTRFLRDKLFTAIAVPAFVLLLASPSLGQERKGFVKEGGYLGVAGLLDFTLDGESFDGLTYYQEVDGDEILILPRLDKRNMIRPILGYRAKKAALEFSYDRTKHDGTFGDATGEAIFQSINVDGRYYFATQGRIQPHILVGGAFPWLRVKDGSFLNEEVGDGRWRGYGINTEAGVTVYPTPQLGIAAGYHYRVMWFDRATGVSDTLFELRPRFRETAGTFILTGLFTF
jgi:hypothetical protein